MTTSFRNKIVKRFYMKRRCRSKANGEYFYPSSQLQSIAKFLFQPERFETLHFRFAKDFSLNLIFPRCSQRGKIKFQGNFRAGAGKQRRER
jgi:hypothetical protein